MMIKPNELRNGNLIEATQPWGAYPAGIVEVTEVLQDGINLSQGDMTIYRYEILKGISLTPEWLERLGFPNDLSTMDAGGNYSVVFERREDKLYLIATSAMESEIVKEIQFVHEFQNLLHALKGEEVKI